MSSDFDTRRKQLSELNEQAWSGLSVFPTKKLDSSLKKNTAYIKKIRTSISTDSSKSLIDGLATTSLEKYLNELLPATFEGLTKITKNQDLSAAVEVVSALHQRFNQQFTPFLQLSFVWSLANPTQTTSETSEKEEKERLVRQRNLLKIFMELYLVGLFRSVNDMPKAELPPYLLKKVNKGVVEPIIVSVLKEVLSFEFTQGTALSVASSFLKRFSGSMIFNAATEEVDNSSILYDDIKKNIEDLFITYSTRAVQVTENYFKQLGKQKDKQTQASLRTGRLIEDIEERIDQLQVQFEKFKNYCDYACDVLQIEKPDLTLEESEDPQIKVSLVTNTQSITDLIWENEDIRKFYTDVPSIDTIVSLETLAGENKGLVSSTSNETTEEDSGSKMTELLVKLDQATNGKEVDEVVVSYWSAGLNNKASRGRIYRHFIETKETNKLKNFARFLAVNDSTDFDSYKEDLITHLDKRFRFQIHTDRLDFVNIGFFCELVKFKLVPIYVLFHKIRTLITNISTPNNIDILSLIFEDCGKLLIHDPEYAENTKGMIELLKEKRNDKKITREDRHAVNLFLATLNPPSIKKLNSNYRELTLEEKFMDHLVSTELKSTNWKAIAMLFKEMDWTNSIVVERIKKIFVEPDRIRFDNVSNLALMFHHLFSSTYRRIKIEIVDELIERVTIGLEDNDYKFNRIRLTQIKYLAELINLKIIKSDVTINLLYKIVCFGHANNNPSVNEEYCELDPTDNYFRVQLVCDFLMGIDLKLVSKKVLNQLNVFYQFFDYYVFTKDQPLPFETNYKVHSMYMKINELHERPTNYKDAVNKLQEALSEQGFAAAQKSIEEEDEDEDEEDDDDDEIEVDDDLLEKEIEADNSDSLSSENESDEEDSDEESEEDDSDDSEDEDESDEEDEDAEQSKSDKNDELFEKEVAERFNQALEAEFSKLTRASMQYNMNSNVQKNTRLENPTVILSRLQSEQQQPDDHLVSSIQQQPLINEQRSGIIRAAAASETQSDSKPVTKPTFTFLSRDGRKTNVRELNLPENVKFTSNFIKEAERQKKEKATIKSLVLSSVEKQSQLETRERERQKLAAISSISNDTVPLLEEEKQELGKTLNTIPGPFQRYRSTR